MSFLYEMQKSSYMSQFKKSKALYSSSQSPLNAVGELNDSYHTYNERSIKVYKAKDLAACV